MSQQWEGRRMDSLIKIHSHLSKIRYLYVEAQKGKSYFSNNSEMSKYIQHFIHWCQIWIFKGVSLFKMKARNMLSDRKGVPNGHT